MAEFRIENSRYNITNVSSGVFLYDVQGHNHGSDCYELHYIYDGRGSVIVDGREYKLSKNSLFVTGGGICHSQRTDKNNPMAEYCVNLWVDAKNDMITSIFTKNEFWIGRGNSDLKKLFEAVCRYNDEKTVISLEMMSACAKMIVLNMVRLYSPQFNNITDEIPDDKRFVIIEDAFLFECDSITLDSLSKRLNMSRRQTQRLIKKYYGDTFINKRTESRMEKANLMADEGSDVKTIAKKVGYSDTQAFLRAFENYKSSNM